MGAFLLRIKNVSYKSYRETQTHFKINNIHFSENRAVNEQMWKNVVEPDRPQVTIK